MLNYTVIQIKVILNAPLGRTGFILEFLSVSMMQNPTGNFTNDSFPHICFLNILGKKKKKKLKPKLSPQFIRYKTHALRNSAETVSVLENISPLNFLSNILHQYVC